MTRRIDAQKAVLASEKLAFAAGRVGPGLRHRGDAAPAPSPPVAEPEVARSLNLAAAEPEPEWIPAYMLEEKKMAPRIGRIAPLTFVMLLLIAGALAALHIFGGNNLPLAAIPHDVVELT